MKERSATHDLRRKIEDRNCRKSRCQEEEETEVGVEKKDRPLLRLVDCIKILVETSKVTKTTTKKRSNGHKSLGTNKEARQPRNLRLNYPMRVLRQDPGREQVTRFKIKHNSLSQGNNLKESSQRQLQREE